MLEGESFIPRKLTAKQIYQEKLMRESDDLVAQMNLIRERTNEVNKLRGLDMVRWKHEITHIRELKRMIDTGKRVFPSVE